MSLTGVGSTHMDHFVQQKKKIVCEMQAGLKVPLWYPVSLTGILSFLKPAIAKKAWLRIISFIVKTL